MFITNLHTFLGGFCVVFFQIHWVHHNGPAVTFGCQAAIVAAAIASIIAVQLFGKRWRAKIPPPARSAEN